MTQMVYLSGRIHAEKDDGTSWRRHAGEQLKAKGYHVFDPTVGDFKHDLNETRLTGEYEAFHELMERVIDRDLVQVDESDIVLVYLPDLGGTVGTIVEVFHAWQQGKAVFLIHEVPFEQMNPWLLHMSTAVFRQLDDALEALPDLHEEAA